MTKHHITRMVAENNIHRFSVTSKRSVFEHTPRIANNDIYFGETENVIFDGENVIFDGEQVVA